ncbi:MAG: hypothetical protein PWP27_449 [Clostridiales bacterium]|jgi:hypothetical protein|nr:hypothetical protein [Clostridiales bacterium]MDK2932639.1 hypothetical protein [Clostridiales bacterium]
MLTGGINTMKLKKIKNFFHQLGKINIINKNVERCLVFLSSFFVLLLIISQIGLINKTTRTFFTDIEQYEGVNINDLEEVFKHGELTLQLIDGNVNQDIKILLNGATVYKFETDTLNIKVRNNCLVEIDGTKVKSPFKVKIIDVSDNIATYCKDKEVEVKSNIEVLTRIFLN